MEDTDPVLDLWKVLCRFARHRLELPFAVAQDELGAPTLYAPSELITNHCTRAGLPNLSVVLNNEEPAELGPARLIELEAVFAHDWLTAPAPSLEDLTPGLFIPAGRLLADFTRGWLDEHRGTVAGITLARAILDIEMDRLTLARSSLRGIEGLARNDRDTRSRVLALLWVGVTYIHAGQDKEAIPVFRAAVRLDESAGGGELLEAASAELADALFRLERYDEAAQACSDALHFAPDDVDLRLLRARSEWLASRPERAIPDLEALAKTGELLGVLCELGQCLAEAGEGARAVEALERALAEQELDSMTAAYARNGLGLAYTRLGNAAAALRAFAASEALCPENAWLFFNRGLYHDRFGTPEEALVAYERSLEAGDPHLPPTRRETARARVSALRLR